MQGDDCCDHYYMNKDPWKNVFLRLGINSGWNALRDGCVYLCMEHHGIECIVTDPFSFIYI